MSTSGRRITAVIGAHVPVSAIERVATYAGPAGTSVDGGAKVVIVAGGLIVCMSTTGRWVTVVVCTYVSVIAVERRSTDATAAGAGVIGRAGVIVIARSAVVGMRALLRDANLVRARITVVRARDVSVPTTRAMGKIICTRIIVVAIKNPARLASAVSAADGAEGLLNHFIRWPVRVKP